MNRYQLVAYEEASPETRAIYDDFLRCTGSSAVPHWLKSLGASPDLLSAYWQEMVIFVVSVENGSRYCSACHAHAVLSLDPTLQFEHLMSLTVPGDNTAGLPATYRHALDFAIEVARSPNDVSDESFAKLYDADFTEQEVRELVSLVTPPPHACRWTRSTVRCSNRLDRATLELIPAPAAHEKRGGLGRFRWPRAETGLDRPPGQRRLNRAGFTATRGPEPGTNAAPDLPHAEQA
jgi:hypothetical protein